MNTKSDATFVARAMVQTRNDGVVAEQPAICFRDRLDAITMIPGLK
jgi:hypothetical protein